MIFDNTSTDDLLAELNSISDDVAEWMGRAALILVELGKRGQKHHLMKSGALRYYREIAEKKLCPKALLAIGGNRNLTGVLMALPLDQQNEYVTTKTVSVVEFGTDGEQVIVERMMPQLEHSTLHRVVGPNGLRPIQEQRDMLKKTPVTPIVHERFPVDMEAKTFKVGNTTLRPSELSKPLAALGWKLTRIET